MPGQSGFPTSINGSNHRKHSFLALYCEHEAMHEVWRISGHTISYMYIQVIGMRKRIGQ